MEVRDFPLNFFLIIYLKKLPNIDLDYCWAGTKFGSLESLVPVPLNKNETEIGYAFLEPGLEPKMGSQFFKNPNQTGTKILVFKESKLGFLKKIKNKKM
jgi:hypothetical protein